MINFRKLLFFSHSVWLNLCDPMDCSTPGLPVHHHLLELAQIHVHWVGGVTQPSHPLSHLSPSAFNLSQHQGLFQWSALCIRWPKYWSFSFSTSPFNGYSRLISERLLLNDKTPGFLASGGDEFKLGPETRLDRSELLCNKVLLKYKGDRESFWHRHQKGAERVPPC